ncbi:MAG: hypothetical protein IJ134_03385 [Bacilli bacterium]|nr:hypothetical protein [Bacilli bacterium]
MEVKGSIKERIKTFKLIKERRIIKLKKEEEIKLKRLLEEKKLKEKNKIYSKPKVFFKVTLGLFAGLFENLLTKNNKDLSNKKVASAYLKESTKKQDKIESNLDVINSHVNKATKKIEVTNLEEKLKSEKLENEEIKKTQKKIFEMHQFLDTKETKEKNDLLDRKFFIVEKKIENKKNEFGLKEKNEEEFINLQNKIETDINSLSSKISDAPLYSLYNYEYEVIDLKQKSEVLNNSLINSSIEELQIKLQNKIELKQKEQLGYHIEEKQEISKTDIIHVSDINKVKDILDGDIKAKEKQLKTLEDNLGTNISYKNSFHLVNRLTNTILNTTLGVISFNWFKSKVISRLVSSIFIFNGIREMSNIVNINKKKEKYIDFKSIESSLTNIDSVLDKNTQIIIDSLNEINNLKSNLLNNYYNLKDTDEFVKLFNSIDKIESSLYENNKKILKGKEKIIKLKN